jgi:hypothetical protein
MAGPTRASSTSPDLGQRDAARSAMQQTNPEPLLHIAQPLAQARHRDLALHRGAAEIQGPGHGDESREVAQVEVTHCSLM